MLPHYCLTANIDAIVEGAGLGPDDVGVSWLPLYHDMGLIGLLMTPMLTGFNLALAAPQDFLAVARRLDAVDVGVPRHHHVRAQLRLRARGAGDATARPHRSLVVASGAQRRGADRSRLRRRVLRRRRAVRPRLEVAVLRVRHGRSDARDLVSRFRVPACRSTPSTAPRSSTSGSRVPPPGRTSGACRCSGGRCAGSKSASAIPIPAGSSAIVKSVNSNSAATQ